MSGSKCEHSGLCVCVSLSVCLCACRHTYLNMKPLSIRKEGNGTQRVGDFSNLNPMGLMTMTLTNADGCRHYGGGDGSTGDKDGGEDADFDL